MTNFKGANFRVITPTHNGQIHFLEQDLLYYNRIDHYQSEKKIIDTFGPTWLFAWTYFSPKSFSVYSGRNLLPLEGLHAIFIPQFSIVRWHVYPGDLQWQALVSSTPLDFFNTAAPIVFPINNKIDFKSKKDLIDFLEKRLQGGSIQASVIDQQDRHHRLSRLVKEYFDGHFREDISIREVAQIFQENPVILTRNFTRAYGLSPLKYRQRLRLFEAMKLMNQGLSVTESVFSSGFTNLSEFNRQFKETLNTSPKQFAPRHQASGMKTTIKKVKNPEVTF